MPRLSTTRPTGTRWRLALAPLGAALIAACYPDPEAVRNQGQGALDAVAPVVTADATGGEDLVDAAEPERADVGVVDAGADRSDLAVASPDALDAPLLADTATADAPPDVPDASADLFADVAADAPDAAPPFVRQCVAYAEAWCARFATCAPFGFAVGFGTQARCRERAELNCALTDLPGSRWPSMACAQAYATFACVEFINLLEPIECLEPGLGADGQPCAEETQCRGRRCLLVDGTPCGQCASRAGANGTCSQHASCTRGLLCANGACALPGGAGALCGPATPCRAGLVCKNNMCVARGRENAVCATPEDCDGIAGFGCNLTLGKCVPYDVTSTCRNNMDGSFEVCEAVGTCIQATRQCAPFALEGQACTATGPHCLFPSECVDGSGKACRAGMECFCRLIDYKAACQ